MRLFACDACANVVHYENSACLACGHRLGFRPDTDGPTALVPEGDGGVWLSRHDGSRWRACGNAEPFGCNRLVAADGTDVLCDVCRHHRTIPPLDDVEAIEGMRRIGIAERHLFHSFRRWGVRCPTKAEDPVAGLAFDLLADVDAPNGDTRPVLTGHADGIVTLAAAEADDAEREARRTRLGEPYRTLLGHLRHETGHYWWDRLVRDGGRIDAFRDVFGDETADYGAALHRHYENGPPIGWQDAFVSAYASSHPWEDFAETWAHHMHMVDALDTASAFGISLSPRGRAADSHGLDVDFDAYREADFATLATAWPRLTVAVNAVNRSLGQADFYPFVVTPKIEAKLAFVHHLVVSART